MSVQHLFNETIVADWGWSLDEISKFQSIWKTLPKASKAFFKLKQCSSTELYASDNCTYKTYSLPCIDLCPCQGQYENYILRCPAFAQRPTRQTGGRQQTTSASCNLFRQVTKSINSM